MSLFRQELIMSWALENFGPIAGNRDERAARLVEEAIEICQCEQLNPEIIKRIVDRVYSRPAGSLSQEIGGLGVTLDALAENADINAQEAIDTEVKRITSLPRDHWRRKHAEKVAAGTADLTPTVRDKA